MNTLLPKTVSYQAYILKAYAFLVWSDLRARLIEWWWRRRRQNVALGSFFIEPPKPVEMLGLFWANVNFLTWYECLTLIWDNLVFQEALAMFSLLWANIKCLTIYISLAFYWPKTGLIPQWSCSRKRDSVHRHHVADQTLANCRSLSFIMHHSMAYFKDFSKSAQ